VCSVVHALVAAWVDAACCCVAFLFPTCWSCCASSLEPTRSWQHNRHAGAVGLAEFEPICQHFDDPFDWWLTQYSPLYFRQVAVCTVCVGVLLCVSGSVCGFLAAVLHTISRNFGLDLGLKPTCSNVTDCVCPFVWQSHVCAEVS
jgi:hypothetical protein